MPEMHSYLYFTVYYQYNGIPNKPFILGLNDKDPPGVGVKNSIEYLHSYDKNGLITRKY